MTETNDLRLPIALGQTILDYLAQRPYAEVFELVTAVQRLEPVTPTDDATLEGAR